VRGKVKTACIAMQVSFILNLLLDDNDNIKL
jgi:hypothetical protein